MKQKRCAELEISHSNSQTQYRRMITRELASLYTVPLSAVNGLSRLTTTNNGQARPSFSNRIESERPIRIRTESRSFAGPSLVPTAFVPHFRLNDV